ncbi:hypothetical protein B296_00009303 [Ensete ventricosum]|uniref:Uncharacterized protein n=2 Tax=Ensete ventricosum TaxID=4639 RepID=A0A427B876_ENSVE|nr:hypothetical protein B296_00009303 [Ensete ventricosum]
MGGLVACPNGFSSCCQIEVESGSAVWTPSGSSFAHRQANDRDAQRDSHPPLAMTKREGTTSPRKKQRQSTTSTASPNAMAIAVKPAFLVLASHDIKVAHVFAFTVFVWVLHFRGGAARLGCTRTAPIPSSMHTTPLPLPDLHVTEVEDASRRLVALLATAVKGLTVVDLDDNVSLVEKERTILLEPQVRQCDRRRE